MINQYFPNQSDLVLASDLAGEFPLYLYWAPDQSTLLYSTSITELLKDSRVPKPLKVSNEGLSFLLQSGVVPPPKTAYQDIYIVGIGDRALVSTVNGKINVEFSYQFPFMKANRLPAAEMQPDEDFILQMLAEATFARIDESKPSFLFHSAGKDSNSIVMALAEAGWQDKFTLITHKSKGKADESEISAKIAKQLGFKHHILHEVDHLQAEHHQAIEDYFINAPFPCTDNVTLAYPLYAHQQPELKGANIIDGSGNDVHMGYVPPAIEFKRQHLSKYLKHSRMLSRHLPSESLFHVAGRTRTEWTGAVGLSFSDTQKILPDAHDVSKYWFEKDKRYHDFDYIDLRSMIRGSIIETGIFQRKARNFADSINSNLVLPWANQKVAEYFTKMPEEHLFDRKTLKNKLILRKMLKDRNVIDSDALGKMGFSYDSRSIVLQNWDNITQENTACPLWHQPGLVKVIGHLKKTMQSNHKYADLSGRLIYRIYLLSAWYNRNRYLQTQ
jgi:asparagine synthase (glutamine-hydrolysing)